MKKVLSVICAVTLIGLLVGCSNSNNSNTSQYIAPTSAYTSQTTQALTEASTSGSETVSTTTAVTDSTNSDIEWTEFTYSQKDSQGYTFDITIKLSPWILLSNTETVNKAWTEAGKNHSLPSFDEWGLKNGGNDFYWRPYSHGSARYDCGSWGFTMNDMYYCIGSVKIVNTTENWSFSKAKSHTGSVQMSFGEDWTYACALSKVFYSNSTDNCKNGIDINAKMERDSWGPVEFVLMTPELFSPAYPTGGYVESLRERYFKIFNRNDIEPIRVNIIGKDGEVFSPIIKDKKD